MIRKNNIKDLERKISLRNSWYIGSHLELYAKKPYRLTIEERLKFIKNEVLGSINSMCGKTMILDAGCGDGFYLKSLSKIKNARIFGLDYSILRVLRAKEVKQGSILVNGDLHSIAFKDSSFDIILVNHVLEHMNNDDDVLREIYRILKSGGRMILGVPNEGCLTAQIRNKILQRSILRETDHVNFYKANQLKEKLISHGFEIIKVKREGLFCPIVQFNELLASNKYGFIILNFLGRIFKSQCAGLNFICKK